MAASSTSSLYEQRFGDLRSLISQPPSPLGFARVCKALSQLWPRYAERVCAELLPYLEPQLERWPSSLRAHPLFWLELWLNPSDGQPFEPARILRVLRLEQQRLGAAVVQQLAQHQAWHRLEVLALDGNLLGADEILTLAGCPFAQLRVLSLSQNELHDRGVEALIEAPWLDQLHELFLWRIDAGAPALGALCQRLAASPQLERVWLGDNDCIVSPERQRWLEGILGDRLKLGSA